MTKFFIYPFAVIGDKTAIPDTAQPNGSVSYQMGFTSDYQLVYPTDPSGKAVPRYGFNELMYDVTSNIQQYQTHGFPNFITTADNGGSPYPYDINAVVRQGSVLYVSLTNGNTDTPPSVNWGRVQSLSGIDLSIITFQPTTTQIIAAGSGPTVINFNNTKLDSAGIVTGGTGFTPYAGWWLFSKLDCLAGGTGTPGHTAMIYKNGQSINTSVGISNGIGEPQLASIYDFASGTDLYQVVWNVTGTGTETVGDPAGIASNIYVTFSAQFIRG